MTQELVIGCRCFAFPLASSPELVSNSTTTATTTTINTEVQYLVHYTVCASGAPLALYPNSRLAREGQLAASHLNAIVGSEANLANLLSASPPSCQLGTRGLKLPLGRLTFAVTCDGKALPQVTRALAQVDVVVFLHICRRPQKTPGPGPGSYRTGPSPDPGITSKSR